MKFLTQHYTRDLNKYYRQPVTQVTLAVVLSLFVMTIFIVFALGPTLEAITTLQRTIAGSRTTLQQLDLKVNNLQKASTQLGAIKANLTDLNNGIPNHGAESGTFASEVEQLAAGAGVTIESGSTGATLLYSNILAVFTPDKSQSVVPLPYTLRVIGTYPATYTFLSQLMTLQRIVSVDSVTITKQAIENKVTTESVAMDISGSVYYLASADQLKQALIEKKGTP